MRVLLLGLISLFFLAAPVSGLAAEKLTDEELDKVSAAGDLCSLFGFSGGCSISHSEVINGSFGTTSTITTQSPDNGGTTFTQTSTLGGIIDGKTSTTTITQTNSFNSPTSPSTSTFSCTGSCSIVFP